MVVVVWGGVVVLVVVMAMAMTMAMTISMVKLARKRSKLTVTSRPVRFYFSSTYSKEFIQRACEQLIGDATFLHVTSNVWVSAG